MSYVAQNQPAQPTSLSATGRPHARAAPTPTPRATFRHFQYGTSADHHVRRTVGADHELLPILKPLEPIRGDRRCKTMVTPENLAYRFLAIDS
jgi:hypothetical protein